MLSDRILEEIEKKDNPSVIGLDTRFEYLPDKMKREYLACYGETMKAAAEGILCFNMALIDSLYDMAAVVKVQSAFYEMYGPEGVRVFHGTCEYAAAKGMIVIADCKRNDIGSSAAAYSAAYLGETQVGGSRIRAFGPDCLTVNPYLGTDGLMPFIEDCNRYDKAIFILVKTSNPSSAEYQDRLLKETGDTLYMDVATKINGYIIKTGIHGYSNIGAVAGATYPEAAARLRKLLSKSLLLVPGYGVQGADPGSIGSFFDKNGSGALINSSRAILLAYKELKTDDYAEASRAKAIAMRDDINATIKGAR